MKKRYTVFSYIIGDYEKVHEIDEMDPEAEYILVTDNLNLKSQTWNIVHDHELDGMSLFNKCYEIRFNCFKYCNTDICLRLDGSIKIKHSLKILIDMFEEGNYDFALMPHPLHDNPVDEYAAWVKCRGYSRKQADHCLEEYRKLGYDLHYHGLFQNCFCISKRTELSRNIEKDTLDLLKKLGHDGKVERINQVPMSVVINSKYPFIKVMPVSEQILRSYYMQWYQHGSERLNMHVFGYCGNEEHYLFNEKVHCLCLPAPDGKYYEREEDLQTEILNQAEQVKMYRKLSKRLIICLSVLAFIVAVLILYIVL